MASAISGATCDESSHSDPGHTCMNALLDDDSYWQTDGEGPGARIKVSFPRANVRKLGFIPGCNGTQRIKGLSIYLDDAEDQLDVSCSVTSLAHLGKSPVCKVHVYETYGLPISTISNVSNIARAQTSVNKRSHTATLKVVEIRRGLL